MKLKITDDEFRRACKKSISMSEACSRLGMHFNTFVRHAKRLNCYEPNQGLKGGSRYKPPIFKTEDILNGKHPQYQTLKLKNRLLKEGIKENKCEVCGQDGQWNGTELKMELNHIDGNCCNHKLENLEMICPNCHSQAKTFRGKNIKR